MIKHIRLKFGSSSGAPKLEFEPTAITIFVGPNNAGKSKAVAEIGAQCINGQVFPTDVILDNLSFMNHSPAEAEALLETLVVTPPPNTSVVPGWTYIKQRGGSAQIPHKEFIDALVDPNDLNRRQRFAAAYASQRTLVLNGRNRTDLSNEQPMGDLQQPAASTFQHLFRDDALRGMYRALVNKSLNVYPVIDPTKGGQLRMRLSAVEPASPAIERGLSQASVEFHGAAQLIDFASDGAKAFTGLLAETMAGDPQILLMDEPEAFLHPSLAFNLGRDLGRSLAGKGKQMLVSTHSAQFVMGCIQSGAKINVVRLTYRGGQPTARILPSEDIVRLMRNPLLRSTGVLSALFYESVVVTEADSDRAFYQEVNERLLRVSRGIPNCIFLNAQNKDTIPFIVAPLRNLGIPAAAIYDLDLVKNNGSVATRFMETAGIPELQRNSMTLLRAAVFQALEVADPQWKRNGGISVLESNDIAAAENYLDQLSAYGAFVVQRGELESWLPSLGVTGQKSGWLVRVFETMGEDPDAAGYTAPGADDVWAFMDEVAAWLLDPNRKGIKA